MLLGARKGEAGGGARGKGGLQRSSRLERALGLSPSRCAGLGRTGLGLAVVTLPLSSAASARSGCAPAAPGASAPAQPGRGERGVNGRGRRAPKGRRRGREGKIACRSHFGARAGKAPCPGLGAARRIWQSKSDAARSSVVLAWTAKLNAPLRPRQLARAQGGEEPSREAGQGWARKKRPRRRACSRRRQGRALGLET